MAIRIRFGPIGGTLERITLLATVYRTDFALLTETDARDALNADLPVTALGYSPSTEPKDTTIKERCKYAYTFEVSYMADESIDKQPPPPPATGTVVREVAAHARSIRRSEFLESVGVFKDGTGTNAGGTDYRYLRMKIGAASVDSHYTRSQEKTFEPLQETQSRKWYPPNAHVTGALLNACEALLGCFNNDTYLGKPAGSLQLVHFEAAPRNRDDWELYFGYGYKAPRTNVYISQTDDDAVKIPLLRGCDYYWTKDEQHFDSARKILQLKTKLAVVGRVWELGDFTTTGIDATGVPYP